MNWVDYVIIIAWSVSLFLGWRIGLYGAVFTAGGLAVGVVAASKMASRLAQTMLDMGILGFSAESNSTIAIGVAYGGIILVSLLTSQVLRAVIRGLMKMVFLGWVDRVGGLALGAFMGTLISIAVIGGLARAAGELIPDRLSSGLNGDEVSSVQARIYSDLSGSDLTSVLLDIGEIIPRSGFGLIPKDLRSNLEDIDTPLQEESPDTGG